MTDLPWIDEHATEVDAPPERAWTATCEVISRSSGSRRAELVARALGCREQRPEGPVETVGSTVTGFRVAQATRPSLLSLEGEHRFSIYSLTLRIDRLDDDRSVVRAETRAAFPGKRGRAYRALVIGTRGHVVAVRRILHAVKRRAQRVPDRKA